MAHSSEIEKLERRWMDNPTGLTFAPLAEAYRRAGDHARALEVLELGLAQHSAYVPALIVQARCHLDARLEAEAEASFRAVLQHDAHNLIALKGLADIAERSERLQEAIGHLDRLLDADPSHAAAGEQRERILSRLGPDATPVPAPDAPPPAEPDADVPPLGFETTAVEAESSSPVESAPDSGTEWTIDRSIDAEMPAILEPIDPIELSSAALESVDSPESGAPEATHEPASEAESEGVSGASAEAAHDTEEQVPNAPEEPESTREPAAESTPEETVEIERASGPFEGFDASSWDLPFMDAELPDQAFEETSTLDAVSQDPVTETANQVGVQAGASDAPADSTAEDAGSPVRVLEERPEAEESWIPWAWAGMPEEEPEPEPAVSSSPDLITEAEPSEPVPAAMPGATRTDESGDGEEPVEAILDSIPVFDAADAPVEFTDATEPVAEQEVEDRERLQETAPTDQAGSEDDPIPTVELEISPPEPEPEPEPEPVDTEPPVMVFEVDPIASVAAPDEEIPEADAEPVTVAASEGEEATSEADESADLVEVVEGAEDEEPAELPEREPEIEPELVITETMAEVFLRQGHRPLALAVYAQLLERDPGNTGLAAAVSRLRGELLEQSGRTESKSEASTQREEPVGSFLARVLGPEVVDQGAPPKQEADPPVEEPGPLSGRPTRPADDASLRLSSIFGDERARRAPPAGEPAAEEGEPSFDEFFGAAGGPGVVAGAGGEEADLEQFNAWLRSLQG